MNARFWLAAFLLAVAGAAVAEERSYRVVGPDEASALPVAQRILTYLAADDSQSCG